MNRPIILGLFSVLISMQVLADIPYKMRDGIEEVDYEKLNPIPGFKLPDSGQFRDATFVTGEDEDYSRYPMSFDISEDGEVVIDNNTGLMWERNLNWRWGKIVPPKGKWRPQDVFAYKDMRAYSIVRVSRSAAMMTGVWRI